MAKKRTNIIAEIIATEKSYVQDLSECLATYYKEFTSSVAAIPLPDYLRGRERVVFGNLADIHR